MQSIFVYSITKQTDRFEIEQKVVYLQNLVQHVLKMSFYFFFYFQCHETNVVDALHCGDVLLPQTFCHISLSSQRICKIFHPYVFR